MLNPKTLSHLVSLFALATLILGLITLLIFPRTADLAEGFRTPIIAFEFAQTESDLAFLSGDSEFNQQLRAQMDAGHRWDMLFPIAYAGFITLLLYQVLPRNRNFKLLLLIPLSIIPFDINENLVLLGITSALAEGAPIDSLLAKLPLATWLKWGMIGVTIAMLSFCSLSQKKFIYAGLGGVTAIGVAYCGIFAAPAAIIEVMSGMVFLFFFVSAMRSFHVSWKLLRHD